MAAWRTVPAAVGRSKTLSIGTLTDALASSTTGCSHCRPAARWLSAMLAVSAIPIAPGDEGVGVPGLPSDVSKKEDEVIPQPTVLQSKVVQRENQGCRCSAGGRLGQDVLPLVRLGVGLVRRARPAVMLQAGVSPVADEAALSVRSDELPKGQWRITN